MEAFFKFLQNNAWLNLIFLIINIGGIILAVIFYFRGKKSKIPQYCLKNFNLVRGNIKKIKNVEILYEGKKVDNLTVSNIAFFNGGKETIKTEDIAKADPIRIKSKNNNSILYSEIIYKENEANNLNINLDKEKNEIAIEFDYLDFEEGVIIQVYHTGISGSDLEVIGHIIGTKKIKEKKVTNGTKKKSELIINISLAVIMITIFLASIINDEYSAITIAFFLLPIVLSRFFEYKNKLPFGFEEFHKNL